MNSSTLDAKNLDASGLNAGNPEAATVLMAPAAITALTATRRRQAHAVMLPRAQTSQGPGCKSMLQPESDYCY